MRQRSNSKDGGLLLSLIVVLVVVGVLGGVVVRLVRSQAVSQTRAYNLMRARYAADSGMNYLRNLPTTERNALAGLGELTYTLDNGDWFVLNITTETNFLNVSIVGIMVGASSPVATRRLNAKFSLLGGGGSTEDGETPTVEKPTGQIEEDTGDMDHADLDAVVDKKISKKEVTPFIPKIKNNDKPAKNSELNYVRTLNLHEGIKNDTLYTSLGRQTTKLRTDLNIRYAEFDPADNDHLAWSVALPMDYSSEAATARSLNNTYLAYDVQAKVSWQRDGGDQNRETGATGLAFKFHGEPGAYQFYAVTLMKYRNQNETGNLLTSYDMLDINVIDGYSSTDGYWGKYDCIPNDIKPPGKTGRLLLVLWKQWVDNNGDVQRKWLMCQDLTAERDFLYQYNGIIDATILLRVLEGTDSDGEFIDVTCFVGDALSWHGDWFWQWVANNNPYDRPWYRRPYNNATDWNSPFVIWNPLSLDDWGPSIDYFTLTRGSANVTLNTGVTQLEDSHTFRLYDADYLSRNQQNRLGELAFIFSGNFLTGATNLEKKQKDFTPEKEVIDSLYMAVDDFALRWLITASTISEGTGGEIITEF